MTNKNESKNYHRTAGWTLGIGILLVVLSPWLFTNNACNNRFDFTETGQIGDTIGGLTAPLVGLIGAVLLYLALRAQLDGNRATKAAFLEQRQVEDLTHLYSNIKQSIDQFTYFQATDDGSQSRRELKGAEAIYELIHDFFCNMCDLTDEQIQASPKLTELISILELFKYTLDKISQSTVANKEVVLTLTKHQFKYRVYPRLSLEGTKLEKYHCKDCKKMHGLPDDIAKLIKELKERAL